MFRAEGRGATLGGQPPCAYPARGPQSVLYAGALAERVTQGGDMPAVSEPRPPALGRTSAHDPCHAPHTGRQDAWHPGAWPEGEAGRGRRKSAHTALPPKCCRPSQRPGLEALLVPCEMHDMPVPTDLIIAGLCIRACGHRSPGFR